MPDWSTEIEDRWNQDVEERDNEIARLREALENVAAWDAEKALRFGNVGVREYAESVLRPEGDDRG